jgi:hypothetical protein
MTAMSEAYEAMVDRLTVEMMRPVPPYEPVARPPSRAPAVSVAQSDSEDARAKAVRR